MVQRTVILIPAPGSDSRRAHRHIDTDEVTVHSLFVCFGLLAVLPVPTVGEIAVDDCGKVSNSLVGVHL